MLGMHPIRLTQADLFMTHEGAGVAPGALPVDAPDEASGLAFFEAWRTARLLDRHRKPMGAVGLSQAAFVWHKWLAFCSGCGLDWRQALPADVRAFAGTLTPRRLGTSLVVSPVTLKRYWRILNDLYAHAVLTGLLQDNPAVEVMPRVSEKTSSMALAPHLWARLQEGLPAGFGLKARRDRLVLLLMMRCALTVGEIRALTLGSVEAHAGSPQEVAEHLALAGLPLLQPESPFWSALPPPALTTLPAWPASALLTTYTLQLSGPRPVQRRRLVLDARTSGALADYVQVKKLGKAALEDRLIVGSAEGAAITPRSLYGIGQAHIARCLPDCEMAQTGPNTLRNSCIACWLRQGVTLAEVLRRCGLRDAGLLIRLQRHINPELVL